MKLNCPKRSTLTRLNPEASHPVALRPSKKTHTYNSINNEAKQLASNVGIANRVEALPKRHDFITIKDHKPNFSRPKCYLINQAKEKKKLSW